MVKPAIVTGSLYRTNPDIANFNVGKFEGAGCPSTTRLAPQ
jgi:hypothetical protein